MENILLEFNEFVDKKELSYLFEQEELDILEKIDRVYESENFYDAYHEFALESAGSAIADAFKRNPDESTGKKLLKYFAASMVGTAGVAVATLGKFRLGGIGVVLSLLALGVYRSYTDKCDSKNKDGGQWNTCMADSAKKAIAFEKENYNTLKSAISKIKNSKKKKKQSEKLEKAHKKNMENLNNKLEKHKNAAY